MNQNLQANDREPESGAKPGHSSISASPSIPDHQLLRPIGRGSYGQVWLARSMMGMYRAVKIVYRRSFEDHRPFERELSGIRKFEPISRSYEGFVDILQVGINQEQDYFYYVMELGDDQDSGQNVDPEHYSPKTLAKEISLRGKLSFQECLQLGLVLSQALGELHRHGLVHRDVKPSNIIFVNGAAKLADIGLVAGVNEADSYVGTQGFIPPEGPGTPQADIYSLGKVLYEASTGKDRQDFPELPTQWGASPDHEGLLELNEVILQACSHQPSKRYQSASDLHADLVVVSNGRSVKRLKLLERRLSHVKRATGISALILVLAGAISFQVYRERRRTVDARLQQVGANVAYGNRAMESGDLSGALPYYAEALRSDQGDPDREREHRLRLGAVRAQCPRLVQMWSEPGEVEAADFSPNGRYLMTVGLYGKAEVVDLELGKPISPSFGQNAPLWRCAFSPDGNRVLTSGQTQMACVWRVSDWSAVLNLAHPGKVFGAAFSPDGSHILTGCEDGSLRLWDARSGELRLTLQEHTEPILYVTFSRDGRLLASCGRDNTARIWNVANGVRLGPPLQHPTWVGYVDFSPDGKTLLTACFDRKARFWEVATGRQLSPELNHSDGVKSARFSPDGRFVVTGCLDRTARLWTADTHQPLSLNPILRQSDRVTYALFSPDGHRIATTCTDGTVWVWDLASWSATALPPARAFSGDGSRFLAAAEMGIQVRDTSSRRAVSPLIPLPLPNPEVWLSGDGRFFLTLSFAGNTTNRVRRSLEIRDTQTGKPVGPLLELSEAHTNVLLSADARRLLAFGGDSLETWNVVTGRQLARIRWPDENIRSALFAPAGNKVAAYAGYLLKVWDAVTGRELFTPLPHNASVTHAEFSPDGSRLLTCCADQAFTKCAAQIWEATMGRPIGAPLMHNDGVLYASFSPDGRRVVTAGEDFAAIVWDAASGGQLTSLLKHEQQVATASFSGDGKWVVSAGVDGAARVWSSETGDPLTPPLRHPGMLGDAKFLPGQSRLFTLERRGKAWLWDLPVDQRPVEDILLSARLLSGGTITPSGWVQQSANKQLDSAWRQLTTKYPADFAASQADIAAWHQFQSEESERQNHWFAAAFHLERLLRLRPDDRTLSERYARAKQLLRGGS